MAWNHSVGNVARDTAIQINGGVQGSVNLAVPELQPSFFKTSNYEAYKNFNPKRVPQTCRWFLEHSTFQQWKSSTHNDLLWLSADPGCGKSVLSRALVDEKVVGADSLTVCYFFFKDNDEQNSAATALCALIHQLVWTHKELLQKYAFPAFKKCGEALKKDFEELWRVFTAAATDSSAGEVVCILDALDECNTSDRKKLIYHLEEFHSHSYLTSNGRSWLKFLVTSRPYGDIEHGFSRLTGDIPTIRLAGEDESDKISHEIGIVIEVKVKEITQRCGLNSRLQSSLRSRLNEIPNRTYLWLHLTLNEVESKIRRGKTEKRLLAIINTLSSTIEEAYETILADCDEEEASKILQIIVAAQRPLTIREIDIALELELDSMSYEDLDRQYEGRKESIRENCGLFISIVDSRVYLIHQTAQEFLVRNYNQPTEPYKWKHSIDLHHAQQILSEICVTYLCLREIQQLDARDMGNSALQHDFLDYSAKYWIYHVKNASIRNIDHIPRTVRLCDIGDASSCTWFRIFSKFNYWYRYHSTTRTTLWWAVAFGLINETKFILENSLDHNSQSTSLDDVLVETAKNRDHGDDLMRLLLDRRGDEVKITEQVLETVAGNKHNGKDMMELLLDRRGDEVKITEQVLETVARNWISGKGIMELLLDRRGDEVKITEQVIAAAMWNSSGKNMMELLLDRRGDEVKITEQVLETVAGNFVGKDIMELLLDRRGDEVKITEQVIVAVAGNEHNGKDMMELLLDRRGDEVKITEQVIAAAAGNQRSGKDMMELLLDRRGDEVKITEQVIAAAAWNSSGKNIMEPFSNPRKRKR